MYPGGHLDHVQDVYSYQHVPTVLPYHNLNAQEPQKDSYMALFGASELFAQLDDNESDSESNSDYEPDEDQYLSLAGARELFAQLGQMEPRPKRKPRKRGAGRKRNEAEEQAPEQLNGYSMNLYGASELYAQL